MFIGDSLKQVNIIKDKAYKSASPTQIKGDNQAALALVGNKHIHDRSKHIDVNYYNIRDLYKRNLITDKHKAFKQQLGIKTNRSLAGRSA